MEPIISREGTSIPAQPHHTSLRYHCHYGQASGHRAVRRVRRCPFDAKTVERSSPMCTVSWFHTTDGYQLFCNRDERLTRLKAIPPRLHKHRNVTYIAPEDGDHRGTWIGVNQFGLALCLLNRYQDSNIDSTSSYTSRGLLVADLLDSYSQADFQDRIEGRDLSVFQPFTIVAIEPEKNRLLVGWTGRERIINSNAESELPLVSSSYDFAGAAESRRSIFHHLTQESGETNTETFSDFHASHLPARGPYSPCMHRADAETVSFSRITVTEDNIEFWYHPLSPCQQAEATTVNLKRAKRPR